jgi:hypothetical protein
LDYYPNLTTIVANSYYNNGNDFASSFSISKLISTYGAGEYTVTLWMNNTESQTNFVGATYTIFINSSDGAYNPRNI